MDESLAIQSAAPTALADLTWLNIGDICTAFGLPSRVPLRGLAELLAQPHARRFAADLLTLDAQVGTHGLSHGSAWFCQRYSDGVEVRGSPPPATGPLLIVANHPGLLDSAALATALPRPDLRVLAIARPLLRALPHINAHLLAVGTDPSVRTTALRRAARHLRNGGALLTFPAGQIEPDPLYDPAAARTGLANWSASLDLLARLAGPLSVQVAIVGGVLAPAALRHPLTRLRRTAPERQYLAAILQLIRPRHYRASVRVQRGQPWFHEPARDETGETLGEQVSTLAQTLLDAVVRP